MRSTHILLSGPRTRKQVDTSACRKRRNPCGWKAGQASEIANEMSEAGEVGFGEAMRQFDNSLIAVVPVGPLRPRARTCTPVHLQASSEVLEIRQAAVFVEIEVKVELEARNALQRVNPIIRGGMMSEYLLKADKQCAPIIGHNEAGPIAAGEIAAPVAALRALITLEL